MKISFDIFDSIFCIVTLCQLQPTLRSANHVVAFSHKTNAAAIDMGTVCSAASGAAN